MTIAIDIGNTRIKLGAFEHGKLAEAFVFDTEKDLESCSYLQNKDITGIIISTVKETFPAFLAELTVKNIIQFSSATRLPIKNNYKTASTLGSDRIPPVIAAAATHPAKKILVIDVGTCIKYNFANAAAEYCGGAISPGLQMRFKALHNFTARLPLIDVDMNYDKLIGESTPESILSGVINGTVAEIDGIIDLYRAKHDNLLVYITGGDSDFFAKRLKNSIFTDPFLVLKGLNDILLYNLKQQ